MSKTFIAVSALIGTIVGAGFLGIPFVAMKSGFGITLLLLNIIAVAIMILMLYLGEIVLRTKSNHQLTGYAEKYLGKKGKIWMSIAVTFGIYSAIVAYLIGEGNSLSYLFFGTTQYSLQFGIGFWLIMSVISYFGLKALEEGESIGIMLLFILIISVSVISFNKIDAINLTYNNPQNLFVPFGVILFAFLGFSIIPEIGRIIGKDKILMKRSIITAYVIAFIVYVLFTFIVLGSQGQNTPQIATLTLGKPFILLGIVTMFMAYLALSVALMDNFKFDLKKNKLKAWLCTILAPLIIFIILNIIGKVEFTKVLGIGGVISGTITAILILLMVKKAKLHGDRKPEYEIPYSKIIGSVIMSIFILGTIFEILHSVN